MSSTQAPVYQYVLGEGFRLNNVHRASVPQGLGQMMGDISRRLAGYLTWPVPKI